MNRSRWWDLLTVEWLLVLLFAQTIALLISVALSSLGVPGQVLTGVGIGGIVAATVAWLLGFHRATRPDPIVARETDDATR